jgi:hypothetical protein
MIHVKILLTNKKDNKKNQPKKLLKRPSQMAMSKTICPRWHLCPVKEGPFGVFFDQCS